MSAAAAALRHAVPTPDHSARGRADLVRDLADYDKRVRSSTPSR